MFTIHFCATLADWFFQPYNKLHLKSHQPELYKTVLRISALAFSMMSETSEDSSGSNSGSKQRKQRMSETKCSSLKLLTCEIYILGGGKKKIRWPFEECVRQVEKSLLCLLLSCPFWPQEAELPHVLNKTDSIYVLDALNTRYVFCASYVTLPGVEVTNYKYSSYCSVFEVPVLLG